MATSGSRDVRVVRARIGVRERLARVVQYRELLAGMIRKELKVKYKNSVLGFAWSLLNPLLYLVVFYVAFDVILGTNIEAFPIFLLSGLLVWNLFSVGLGSATGSIVANSGLVKKVAFPREILPLASVGSTLVHFFLQSIVLFVVIALVQWNVAWAYLPLVPLALVALLLVTGALGILLSAVNVYLRDTQHFLELVLLGWFWMTPVVYGFMTIGRRDDWATKVYMLNPITPIVLVFQRAIYGQTASDGGGGGTGVLANATNQILPDWEWTSYLGYLGWSFGFAFIMLAVAVSVFGRIEANFAEEL